MYEYAKLIADRAIEDRDSILAAGREGKGYWAFVTRTHRKLISGEIQSSSILRENKLFMEQGWQCAYCESPNSLHWEHIIPRSRGGPDMIDNLVLACSRCNLEKAARNPIEWYTDRKLHRKHIPRLVMGKLLKIVMAEHERRMTLESTTFPHGMELALAGICLVFEVPENTEPAI
jgi:5-methylcytosine-specific restriction endonuclease McrA